MAMNTKSVKFLEDFFCGFEVVSVYAYTQSKLAEPNQEYIHTHTHANTYVSKNGME